MLIRLVMPGVLLALCVVVHALVMTGLLRRLSRAAKPPIVQFWPATLVLVRTALIIILAHMIEIGIWAFFLTWQQVFPDPRASFYFSAVTYTTVGYGDLLLPEDWRAYAGVEGLTGILMCGWSTGVFFALVSRMYPSQPAETTGVDKAAGR